MPRIRSAVFALTVAALLTLVACNGVFTLSSSVAYGPLTINAPAGTYLYSQVSNLRGEVGDDIDQLSSFKVLRLELTIDLTNDTGGADTWAWVGGGSLTIQNANVNGGAAVTLATVPDQSGNNTQTLVITVTDQELAGFAQSVTDTTVELSLTVTGSPEDSQIDVNGSIKVKFTIG
jgi:hypothetical protein